jgi:glycosyltransferase involved in cell wall biosynthesis
LSGIEILCKKIINNLNRKPKLLILYDYYPPAYKAGGPVQSLANLVDLLGNDLDIFVLTGARDLNESGIMDGIVTDQWSKTGKASVYYASRISTSLVDRIISEINPVVIYLNGMYSFYLMLYPVIKYGRKRKFILAPRGMLAPSALQIKKWKKIPYIFLLRLLGLPNRLFFHATKDAEKEEIVSNLSKESFVFEIGNVPFPPDSKPKDQLHLGDMLHLYSVARISPEKNVHFIFEVLRNYTGSRYINLHLIGNPENKDYVNSCKKIESLLPDTVTVDWIGHMIHPDIQVRIKDFHVFLSPTLGENFGHAIFEALGAGKPVLISDRTPWHGLEKMKAGAELSLDDPDKWLDKIHFFANMGEKKYQEWSLGAWEYAMNQYKNMNLKEKYLKMFST